MSSGFPRRWAQEATGHWDTQTAPLSCPQHVNACGQTGLFCVSVSRTQSEQLCVHQNCCLSERQWLWELAGDHLGGPPKALMLEATCSGWAWGRGEGCEVGELTWTGWNLRGFYCLKPGDASVLPEKLVASGTPGWEGDPERWSCPGPATDAHHMSQ